MAWDETSVAAVIAGSSRGGAAEQAVRTPDQDHDHAGVDDERTHLRHVVLAGDVADAEQERGEERPGDAGGAADGDHDQEVDHEFQREIWIEAEDLGAERAPAARKAATEGKGERKHLRYVNAEARCGAWVVHRRAEPAAEAGARQDQL